MQTDQLTSSAHLSALERAIQNAGKMDPGAAKEFLRWHLSAQDDKRLDELTARNRKSGLTPEETDELEEICSTIDLLSILHIHAREALGELPRAGA